MTLNPNYEVRHIAGLYNYLHDLPEPVQGHYVPIDTTLASEIAAYYDSMPSDASGDTNVTSAYEALADEVLQQYYIASRFIVFEPWLKDGQPYANSAEMCDDVRSNRHLYYFQGGERHPVMGRASGLMWAGLELSFNDLFRAVHDLFGHAAEGYQFGPRGEENAWIHHSMMFSPLAQRALTTETRGQNSWFNYGPASHLPVSERPFAKQKVNLLPERFLDWQAALAR